MSNEPEGAPFHAAETAERGHNGRSAAVEARRLERLHETWRRTHAWRREQAQAMREKGAVPAVIAERLGTSLDVTLAILRELGYSTRYLDATEYDDEVPEL